MAQVLRVGILFAVVIGLVSVFYELRVRKHDRTIDQISRMRAARLEPEVVLFGDSRGVHDFRHSAMDERYLNLSYFSEDYRAHAVKFATVLREMPGVQALVVPLDRYSLTTHRDNAEYLRAYFFADLDLVAEVYAAFTPNLLADLGAFYFPLFADAERARLWRVVETDVRRWRGKGRERNFDEFGACLELSERYRYGRFAELDEGERARRARRLYDRKYRKAEVSEDLVRAARLLIDSARARGVRVIGVRMPTTREWAALEDADPRAEAFDAALARLPVDTVLDYRTRLAGNPEYFTDPDHLNPPGAEVFSKIVYADLQKLLKREAAAPFACGRVPAQGAAAPAWPYRTLGWSEWRAVMANQARLWTPARP
jgi:hypothetical protein